MATISFMRMFSMTELKDWLNSINFNKDDLTYDDPDCIKDYPAYIVNRCLSGHLDTVLYANEMNLHPNLDKDMQYQFFLNSLRKRKRFSPWLRKDKVDNLNIIKKYYGYSNEKALQALRLLTQQQLDYIKKRLDTGGMR